MRECTAQDERRAYVAGRSTIASARIFSIGFFCAAVGCDSFERFPGAPGTAPSARSFSSARATSISSPIDAGELPSNAIALPAAFFSPVTVQTTRVFAPSAARAACQ